MLRTWGGVEWGGTGLLTGPVDAADPGSCYVHSGGGGAGGVGQVPGLGL